MQHAKVHGDDNIDESDDHDDDRIPIGMAADDNSEEEQRYDEQLRQSTGIHRG